MARFSGVIGYGSQVETAPGIWKDVITEKLAFGDVIRMTKSNPDGISINDDIKIGHSISVVSDEYLTLHFLAIRYIQWSGVRWTIENVEVQHPRLIFRLGSPYNGPIATPSES